MKIFVLITIVSCAYAAKTNFKLAKETSRDALPEIEVHFSNGVKDKMVLEPYSTHPCNFIGRLENHPISSAAVTGCLEKPGDKMDITLLTDLNEDESHMFQMDFHGNVAVVQNPYKVAGEESMRSLLLQRNLKIDHLLRLYVDEITNSDDEAAETKLAAAHSRVNFPRSVTANIKFGYERTMDDRMWQDGTTFDKWIGDIMTHVQSYYRHPTLPVQINFKYDLSKTLYENSRWTTDNLDNAAAAGERDNDPNIHMYVWWGDDPVDSGVIGLAWVGTACDTYYKTSFNEHRTTAADSAYVQAHEMGHNLGMSHDFDEKHGGTGKSATSTNYCNKKGLMSYGKGIPTKWSSCSVSDFTYYWQLKDWGNTCFGNGGPAGGKCEDKSASCKRFKDECAGDFGCEKAYCEQKFFAESCRKACQKC